MMFDITEFKPFSLGYQRGEKNPKKNKPYNFSILKVGCCDLFNNKTRIERIDCQSV